jgi:hypothetical protein
MKAFKPNLLKKHKKSPFQFSQPNPRLAEITVMLTFIGSDQKEKMVFEHY